MADPIVKPIFGEIFLAPPSAGTGGTPLSGVDYAQPINIAIPQGVELERHGLERDAVRSVQLIAPEAAFLFIPAQGHDVETLKLLFAANTADALSIVTSGGDVVPGAHLSRQFSAAIRPGRFGAGEDTWYFPLLSQHPDIVAHVNAHPTLRALANTSLVLVCCKPENSDVPAVGRGSTEFLNALYFPEAAAPPEVEIVEVP